MKYKERFRYQEDCKWNDNDVYSSLFLAVSYIQTSYHKFPSIIESQIVNESGNVILSFDRRKENEL